LRQKIVFAGLLVMESARSVLAKFVTSTYESRDFDEAGRDLDCDGVFDGFLVLDFERDFDLERVLERARCLGVLLVGQLVKSHTFRCALGS
jgi:hypothetical protein